MEPKSHCSYDVDKTRLLNRLKRIEGQVKGLQRMIEEEKYCVDILTQIAAARAALNKVGLIVFEDHIRGCVAEAIDTNSSDEKISELVDIAFTFLK